MIHSSLVIQPRGQLLQWLTYPSFLQVCCYPVYSKALPEYHIVAQWVKKCFTVLGTCIKHSQKLQSSFIFSTSLIQPANSHFIRHSHQYYTLKWDLQFNFSGQYSCLIAESPMKSACPPHPTHLHFVTAKLYTEQYTSFLQCSASPEDSNIKKLRNAHVQCNISDVFTHLCLIISTIIRQYIGTFPSTGFVGYVYTQVACRSQGKVPFILVQFWQTTQHVTTSQCNFITSHSAVLQVCLTLWS